MPRKDNILNLPGFAIKKTSGSNPLILDVEYRRMPRCVYCNGRKLRKKASYLRHVRHESIGPRQTLLRFKAYKFHCRNCNRYFNQQFPGIGKYQRSTERLHYQVFRHHTQGISQKDLSRDLKLGKATIERWYHREYLLAHKEISNQSCPQVLGIDEHFFSKKQGYATTLCDLRKNRIFDVVKGRSSSDLGKYLDKLPGKQNVKVICIDLSSSYRHIIQKYFPQAKIVADRFHVIRLMHHMCMQTYQEIDPKMKNKRGLLAALRTNPENLTEKRMQKRDEYLKQHPAIDAIYQFKQQLRRLLMKKTMQARRCKKYIPVFLKMIRALKESPFKRLITLGKTLYQWREEVVRMWRFKKNNGITEGFHRKMKLIQRRAYGFRSFENYRLRVRVLCS
ncbi:MAG: ISL3 family transposase [Gammaproteobacteria bacterium]|nr:ISL3 family transposase [Gammaproteobacteria bacterium]